MRTEIDNKSLGYFRADSEYMANISPLEERRGEMLETHPAQALG